MNSLIEEYHRTIEFEELEKDDLTFDKLNSLKSTIEEMEEMKLDDKEFMEMQIKHKNQWEELKGFAKEWQIEIEQNNKWN